MAIVTFDDYADVLEYLNHFEELTIDFETTGLKMFQGHRICGVAIEAGGRTFYFPFRHGEGTNLPLELLRPLTELMNRVQWVTWNGLFDVKMHLMEPGAKYPPHLQDAQIAAHLMNENEPSMRLKDVGRRYIDPTARDQEEELVGELHKRGLKKGDMWRLPPELVADYAEQDVRLTRALKAFYTKHLWVWELFGIWEEYNKYVQVIAMMEMRGLQLDTTMIESSIEECKIEALRCSSEVDRWAGYPINVNSPKQVCNLIGLPSSAAEILEALDTAEYPVVSHILEARRWLKASSTYYEQFRAFADDQGVLHPNLNLTGTATGRPSCSKPNLLAIPRKDEEAGFHPKKYVKRCFIPRPGYWLVQADYKQAELYLGAQYAGAKRMIEMLIEGRDLHGETAQMMGIPRPVAKRLNFSMMYGIGPAALSQDLWEYTKTRYTVDQAYQFIKQYNRVHPEMKALYKRSDYEATRKGYIRLLSGRVRHYNGQEYFTTQAKPSPYHKASSNLIQGGVAEIMRMALTRLYTNLASEDVHLQLQVYDSIIAEVPEGRFDILEEIDRTMTDFDVSRMIGASTPTVPFKVDIEVGHRWYDLQPIEKVRADVKI